MNKEDWAELKCIINALEALIEKYKAELQNTNLTEDEKSDITNDLAYAEVLKGKYINKKMNMNTKKESATI